MALNTPINIDNIKTRKSRIYKIGVELEGGWDETLPKGTQVIKDGSVTFPEMLVPPRYVGELPSPPMDLIAMPTWVKKYYPQHVNNSCGLHVHLSFETPFLYQMLMCKEYPSTVVAYVKKWAEEKGINKDNSIWPRLAGKSEFCQHIFNADLQANSKRKEYDRHAVGHRYTVINYCWQRYNTLECRLLPMMATATKAIEAINELISITDKFLVATSNKKNAQANVKEEIELDLKGNVEEIHEIL